ncbi:hypothetical protein [Legionella worsleiensis]|uniref:Ubiquitin-like domain-containing protein n=1 Tax=Legionella worsleiensis TaxID=45076 RepID=A0A0W1AH64_9GAMM|nr:hypothetical protein [Legionella worsleiensis]KTD80705.1 hypothetical protein Lwor_0948 [Legionella worsleiensis]STY32717.1 Uncharacterised protein [Legionella worsleiensis]
MHLSLKTLLGQTISVTVENSDALTSLDIKKLIQKKKCVDIAEQTILIAGRAWADNQSYAEFKEQNPHLPDELQKNRLRLVITPIPEALRALVKTDYLTLKKNHPKLAAQLSKDSRTLRFKEEIHISTKTYWDDLSVHERVKILGTPSCAQLIGLIAPKSTVPFNKTL